jgi:hypothetical protein
MTSPRPGDVPVSEGHRPSGDPDSEVLPEQTRDDRDIGWGESLSPDDRDDDERFLRERPPHWQ